MTTVKQEFIPAPAIVDEAAYERFLEAARTQGLNPEDTWVRGYVERVWKDISPIVRAYVPATYGASMLEFGCNVGASAIMLAHLGARVDAVDIDENMIKLAELNARSHGADTIRFRHIRTSAALPFPSNSFDTISCMSVLEYVAPHLLAPTLREFDRVLKPGGILFSAGTSNRLWPREVHSGRWFSNYLPMFIDRFLGERQRGIFPWQIRLRGYRDLVAEDRSHGYLAAKAIIASKRRLALLSAAVPAIGLFGWSVGMLTPSICLVLRKPL